MGLDFDVLEFCKKLKQDRPPPYQCPLEKCDRVYKSLCGLQYHLVKYDHDNPTPMTPVVAAARKKGGRMRAPVPTGDIALQSPPKEALTFAEGTKSVQFEIDGKISSIPIDQPLALLPLEEWENMSAAMEKPLAIVEPPPEPQVKLPEASYKVIPDYNIPDAPPRPNAYIRFIEKSAEELDGEVEYDADEEDTAWLTLLNKQRANQGLAPVPVDTLELIMDRLEKEAYILAAQTGQEQAATVDEDAVCSICMDGECQNTNVILFCDMCNLAVHQDCYGVPYIPEGQWLCRRCLQAPSQQVNCVLCPNTGGAFKQTDQGRWAHVVCALWIPEVRFANTVFLEPIDCIEQIPAARWRLCCLVCKQRGAGACIQCHKSNCYHAFHVTCAQQAGLYMKMDAVGRGPGQPVHVNKIAYCDAHTPAHVVQEKKSESENENMSKSTSMALYRQKAAEKIKQARRQLALKRHSPNENRAPRVTLARAAAALHQAGHPAPAAVLRKLLPYWTLKRAHRPLLRRLHASLSNHGRGIQDGSVNIRELCNQLKYWQRIRQDLERARLLCELVRKRERVKAEYTRVCEKVLLRKLRPERAVLASLLSRLTRADTADIFGEPVDTAEVQDYTTVVTHPMDLSTMSKKLESGEYTTMDELYKDFILMIDNCLAYNSKDTVFYKAGVKMREQCLPIFLEARRDMLDAGYTDLAGKLPLAEPEHAPAKGGHSREKSVEPTRDVKRATSMSRDSKRSTPKLSHDSARNPRELRRGTSVAKEVVKTEKKSTPIPAKLPPPSLRETKRDKREKSATRDIKKEKIVKRESKRETPIVAMETRKSIADVKTTKRPTRESKRVTRDSSATSDTYGESLHEEVAATTPRKVGRKSRGTAAISEPPAKEPAKSTRESRKETPQKMEVEEKTVRSGLRSRKPADEPSETASQDTEEDSLASGPRTWWWRRPVSDTKPPASGLFTSRLRSSLPDSSLNLSSKNFGADAKLPTLTGVRDSSPKKRGRQKRVDRGKEASDSFSRPQGDNMPASFREYRGTRGEAGSDSDPNQSDGSNSSLAWSCSSCTHYDHSSSTSDDQDWSDDERRQCEEESKQWPLKQAQGSKSSLQPLQLVWAKTRGYPWYPALIIDPTTRRGALYRGVALPTPPLKVLNLKEKKPDEPILYLVLFFDAKRTWQWLPPAKLEALGISKAVDKAKLAECKKARERMAVKKAYEEALTFSEMIGDGPDQEPSD